ncbi:hypothetical protein [Streptomyces sp. NPDC051921]|uniref:hypothetical protein n=1 Tax=Streptomyces sp. NPDC051921 TaxID=3155806 RepID=UPI00342CC49A
MRAFLVAAATALAVGLVNAPAAPAAPPRPAAAEFDFWFNQYGYTPKADLPAGEHRVIIGASCDGDSVGAQLYHVTWGVDRKVGDVFEIPCEGATSAGYQLSGGEYYLYLLSGVDNTHIIGHW